MYSIYYVFTDDSRKLISTTPLLQEAKVVAARYSRVEPKFTVIVRTDANDQATDLARYIFGICVD